MVQPLGEFPKEWIKPETMASFANGALQRGVFGDDRRLSVRFVMFPEIQEKETLAAGYKVLKYREYIRIQPIGDKTTIYFQPAKQADKARFPIQYEAFKSGRQELVGIPIEAWDYQLSETQLLTFRTLGIQFVHEIAGMSDTQKMSLGIDGKNIVARAKITCAEVSEKDAKATLQAKFDEQSSLIAKQQEEIDQMRRIMGIKELEAKEKDVDDLKPTFGGAEDSLDREIAKAQASVAKKRGRPSKKVN